MPRECYLMYMINLIEEMLESQIFPTEIERDYKAREIEYRSELHQLLLKS